MLIVFREDLKRLLNEELYDLYSSYIIGTIKSEG